MRSAKAGSRRAVRRPGRLSACSRSLAWCGSPCRQALRSASERRSLACEARTRARTAAVTTGGRARPRVTASADGLPQHLPGRLGLRSVPRISRRSSIAMSAAMLGELALDGAVIRLRRADKEAEHDGGQRHDEPDRAQHSVARTVRGMVLRQAPAHGHAGQCGGRHDANEQQHQQQRQQSAGSQSRRQVSPCAVFRPTLRYASRNGMPSFTTSSFASAAAWMSGSSRMRSGTETHAAESRRP